MIKPFMSYSLRRVVLLSVLLVICENVATKPNTDSKLVRNIRGGSPKNVHLESISRTGAKCSRRIGRSCENEACQCWADDICRNNELFIENIEKCQECVQDSDCSGISTCAAYWAGNIKGKWCSQCGGAAMSTAALRCMRWCNASQPGNRECKEVECSEGLLGSAVGHDVVYSKGACACRCCNGQTPECVTDYNPMASIARTRCECTGSSKGTSNFGSIGSNNETFFADCVETAWLKKNGLAHGILKERGVSRVLCIPGLPCATEGHLLRECDEHGICELVPYSKVCRENNLGCVVTFQPVSRLSHSVDWSSVRIRHHKPGKSLHLTSVSQHVSGPLYYVSRGIAVVASYLGSHGYGRICDSVLLAILWVEEFIGDNILYTKFVRHLTL